MAYEHLLSPLKIGNVTLKNHMLSSRCITVEANDLERAAVFYENIAQNGAAVVTMAIGTFPDCEGHRSKMSFIHMDDPEVQEQYRQMIQRVHRHGSLCSAHLMNIDLEEYAISDTPNWDQIPRTGDYNPNFQNRPGIPLKRLEQMIEDIVLTCKRLQEIGFDMVTFYMCYRASILANALSPVLNQRTDRYGGKTVRERAALPLEVFRRVKEACGQDFLIEIQTSAVEEAPGYTLDEWLEFCKLCEGVVDIFQVRGWDGSYTHVNGMNSTKEAPYNLQFAEAFMNAGIQGVVSPCGGFRDPDDLERFLVEKKLGAVTMARAFLCDSRYGVKISNGDGAATTPCLLCNKCHGKYCSVNPFYERPELLEKAEKEQAQPKRISVIGGGAAGLRAALFASQRGHQVTVFEKSRQLGGQLLMAGRPWFKWPVAEYLKWLIRGTENLDIRLATEATPELVREGHYDAVLCAMGSVQGTIPVPGAEGSNVFHIDDACAREEQLGKRIVVIGGAETGRETALYLAGKGHRVTMLTRSYISFSDDGHCMVAPREVYERESNFSYLEYTETVEIGDGYVMGRVRHGGVREENDFGKLEDKRNREQAKRPAPVPGLIYPRLPTIVSAPMLPPMGDGPMPDMPPMGQPAPAPVWYEDIRIDCDSVIVTGPRQPRIAQAEQFAGTAPKVYLIGDNAQTGSILECTDTAVAAILDLEGLVCSNISVI